MIAPAYRNGRQRMKTNKLAEINSRLSSAAVPRIPSVDSRLIKN